MVWLAVFSYRGLFDADFTKTPHKLMLDEIWRTRKVGVLLCFVASWHFKQQLREAKNGNAGDSQVCFWLFELRTVEVQLAEVDLSLCLREKETSKWFAEGLRKRGSFVSFRKMK